MTSKSLFKKDPFGIKHKLFRIKLERHLQQGFALRGKELKAYLSIIHYIGIPKNEDARELLRSVLEAYDKMVSDINNELKLARKYVEREEAP